MAKSSISVDDRELLRALERLDKSTRPNVTRKVLRRAAAPMRDDARRRVQKRTRTLEKSIKTYVSARKGEGLGRVESRERYAHLVEGGTEPHFQKRRRKGKRGTRRVIHPGAKPYPFMQPAFDSKKDVSVDIAKRELRGEIDKATKG